MDIEKLNMQMMMKDIFNSCQIGEVFEDRDELKGKRFDTLEEITSMCIPSVFIYDYNEGKCLTPTYNLEN